MTYPKSQPVQPGDVTLADQYNHLRDDALYLGGSGANASLRDLLGKYRSPLRFSVNGQQLTVHATPDAPFSLMIGGCPAVITAALTVTTDSFVPNSGSGETIELYLIAVKDPDAPAFTLEFRGNPSLAATERCIAVATVQSSDGTIQRVQATDQDTLYPEKSAAPVFAGCGRLSAVSNDPCPTYDVGPSDTLYFTPWLGNRIALYRTGVGWCDERFAEVSVSLAGLSADVCYDVFLQAGDDSVTLSLSAWASLTMRNTPLTHRDGILVSEEDPCLRYLGTIGLTEAGKTADRQTDRLIWNALNRRARPLRKLCAATSAGPTVTNAWCPYARDTALFVTAVSGELDTDLTLTALGVLGSISAGTASLGIAIDPDFSDPELTVNGADLCCAVAESGPLTATISGRGLTRILGKRVYAPVTYSTALGHVFNGVLTSQNQIGLSGRIYG